MRKRRKKLKMSWMMKSMSTRRDDGWETKCVNFHQRNVLGNDADIH